MKSRDRRRTETFQGPGDKRILEEERLYASIRDAIEERMEALGMLRKDLAAAAGLTNGRISQILSGDKNLTLKTLASIGVALKARFVAGLQPDVQAVPAAASSSPHSLGHQAGFHRKPFYPEPQKHVPYNFGESFLNLAGEAEPLIMASRKTYMELAQSPTVLVRVGGSEE